MKNTVLLNSLFDDDAILLNNLFNGKYIEEKIGGEIINMYQADNGNHYVYVNPYGNIDKKWDNKIKFVLFMRSVGRGMVKIIGKAEVEEQIALNAVRKTDKGIAPSQAKYIEENKITYGGVSLDKLGSWSNYFVTFKAKSAYKAKEDIYLSTDEKENAICLSDIERINNQSQKLYIAKDNPNYQTLLELINDDEKWEKEPVGQVDLSKNDTKEQTFLSIIRKENDELAISNLLAHFLENDVDFWHDFTAMLSAKTGKKVANNKPKITRESYHNIDLFIEVENQVMVIENKIKSRITVNSMGGTSQLTKYYNAVQYKKEFHGKDKFYLLLRANYNNENYKGFEKGNEYVEIKYADIYEIIKDRVSDDFFFNEFRNVIKKHSLEYDNELFEIMDNRFIQEIKRL
ncbi:PD-(D/E)XK nuclease family protein [Pasteurella atlantica]|uniref:PD-(D/E)XK nuclease family protein n=1 Tax=Pasteurellaceae TaxID=712 RepID=UPI00276C5035|nr:PD-(D/E)XK nuclease family protein [Pasteurella atlantica]MDP8099439.1 PD-(D/E)XK nuclease family protein [Pasteurella atlantica]MDP8107327.1 PD-(D/E)XK nuclease family protein [Pasteurella atlantica]MDP8117019.1 PD-(D/E)XK nuclease family protein [Pasteurella atlantica]